MLKLADDGELRRARKIALWLEIHTDDHARLNARQRQEASDAAYKTQTSSDPKVLGEVELTLHKLRKELGYNSHTEMLRTYLSLRRWKLKTDEQG